MRDLIGKEKVFLRVEENNGETHDLSIQLAGADRVFERSPTTCEFSLLISVRMTIAPSRRC